MTRTPFEILLVEDSETDIEIIREAFGELKTGDDTVALHVAKDGEEAMSFLRRSAADLVILDINLPKKTGFEVLAEIKGDPVLRHLPIVILTTSNRPDDRRRAYAEGAASYIVKPLRYRELREFLQTFLDYWMGVCKIHLSDRKPG